MAYAIVSTVNPNARATPTHPMPSDGNAAASTALPHPPSTSHRVPMNSAVRRFDMGMELPPLYDCDITLTSIALTRPSACELGGVSRNIHVAATDDHPDPLALQRRSLCPHGREAQAPGGLDHYLHSRGKQAHALDEFGIGRGQDIGHFSPDDFEGQAAQRRGLSAVRNRLRHLDAYDRTLPQR